MSAARSQGSPPRSKEMAPEDIGRWIFAIAKHLKVFRQDLRLTYLYATRRSAADGELLVRLRGLGTISKRKVEALALDVGIPVQELDAALVRLESTSLIAVRRLRSDQKSFQVQESIFTELEIYRAIADLFAAANPLPSERAMIPLLDLLSRLPATEEEATAYVCDLGFAEEDAMKALELQEAFGLLRRQQVADFGVALLHNEYLWGEKIQKLGPLIAKLGPRERDWLLALIEEVRSAQGRSLEQLSAAPPHIIAMAAGTGILDTTTITTARGDQKIFTFSPHFYGYRAGPQAPLVTDYADQVKLFVASITYGVHHSIDFRLHSPIAFVRRLLRDGEAGDATPIMRDYILLEKQGIIATHQTTGTKGAFVLQKRDIVEQALDVMNSGSLLRDADGQDDARTLVSQRDFNSPEVNRLTAGFGKQAGGTKRVESDLMAAVREAAQRGTW